MARINPLSTAMRFILSLGQEGDKELRKSVSVVGIDPNADADTLSAAAQALSALMEHPVAEVRKADLGLLVE